MYEQDVNILWYYDTAHKTYTLFSHISRFPVQNIFEYFSLKCFGFVKCWNAHKHLYLINP
jgi:hypothetical protein